MPHLPHRSSLTHQPCDIRIASDDDRCVGLALRGRPRGTQGRNGMCRGLSIQTFLCRSSLSFRRDKHKYKIIVDPIALLTTSERGGSAGFRRCGVCYRLYLSGYVRPEGPRKQRWLFYKFPPVPHPRPTILRKATPQPSGALSPWWGFHFSSFPKKYDKRKYIQKTKEKLHQGGPGPPSPSSLSPPPPPGVLYSSSSRPWSPEGRSVRTAGAAQSSWKSILMEGARGRSHPHVLPTLFHIILL